MGTSNNNNNENQNEESILQESEDSGDDESIQDLYTESGSDIEKGVSDESEEDENENSIGNNRTNKKSKNTAARYNIIENIQTIDTIEYPNDLYNGLPQFLGDNQGYRFLHHMHRQPQLFLYKLFSINMMEDTIKFTNLYGKTNRNTWIELTLIEFKLFLSIILYMGICDLSQRNKYWNDENFQQEFVRKRMTFQRFNDILLSLHVVNVTNLTPAQREANKKADPLWLFAEFSNLLCNHCFEYWDPEQFISLDESSIRYKGRFAAKMYNPTKPNKWHIRQYSLNDASGYLLKFHLYRGSAEVYPDGIKATHFPIFKLTSDTRLHNKGYILVTDRFYSGLEVVNTLHERGIEFLGTVLLNRIPIDKKLVITNKSKADRGDVNACEDEKQTHKIISWMDNKPVNILTTLDTNWHYVSKNDKNNSKKTIKCPTVVTLFTAKMRGTDIFDQLMSYYFPNIRSFKWTVRVFTHLFYIAVINSHFLYKDYFKCKRGDENFELINYINNLMLELGKLPNNVEAIQNISLKRRRHTCEHDKNRLCGIHTPLRISYELDRNDNVVSNNKRVLCGYCKMSETTFICKQCNIGLHIGSLKQMDCFLLYHSEEIFSFEVPIVNNNNNNNEQGNP